MAKIMMDEFHLQVFVPKQLNPLTSRAIRRLLNSKRFQVGFAGALRTFFGRFPSLSKASIKIAA